ncbi:MAG: hypothetical protein JJT95_07150 [Pararhodobacter sp.]|nr:hypothetical protein [Pararhodobacter sp.]
MAHGPPPVSTEMPYPAEQAIPAREMMVTRRVMCGVPGGGLGWLLCGGLVPEGLQMLRTNYTVQTV